jgi:hypothetical protein
MTATQLIAFVVAPLALLALGWVVAFTIDWKGSALAEKEGLAETEALAVKEALAASASLAETEAEILKNFTARLMKIANNARGTGHLTKDTGTGAETLESLLEKLGVTKR